MKVQVNRDLCNGYGNCVLEAPEVFDLDDGGIAVVLQESPTGEQAERARAGARMCPVEAISIEE